MKKWERPSLSPDDYIFCILLLTNTPKNLYRKEKQATHIINRYMKRIGEQLGFKLNLQHTQLITHLQRFLRIDTSTEYISEALGHTSLQTTKNYLDSFEKETLAKNQEKLLNF